MILRLTRKMLTKPGRVLRVRQRQVQGRLDFITLEPRLLLAANVTFNSNTGIVSIYGTSLDDTVTVSMASSTQVAVAVTGGSTATYAIGTLNEIKFWGGLGDDYFANNTSVASFFGGQAGMDTFYGGSGNDRVYAGDDADTLYGGGGDDLLSGGDGNDLIYGDDDNDEIHGGWGNDQIFGGEGDDFLAGEFGDDLIWGEGGTDFITGSVGDDQIWGGLGDDFLYGQGDDDVVRGDVGNDRVRGSNGNDQLFGGDGNDYMMAGAGDDVAYGEGGADIIFSFDGINLLDGGDGNDQIYVAAGTNDLSGGTGDDVIVGGTGEDLVHGGTGDDWINGGVGNDRLFGGEGVDRILGGSGDDAIHGGSVSSVDILSGNDGNDRFLRQANDVITDRATGDAVIEFENYSDLWVDLEIEVVDRAFQQLYDATQNNAFLIDTLSTDDLRFLKYDTLGGFAGTNWLQTTTSWYYDNGNLVTEYNYSREIRIADWDETSSWYNDQYQLVALHEIGHNWDSALELTTVSSQLGLVWDSFIAASGWTETNPNDSIHSQSLDGLWWYDNSASFAENYGRTNPREDAATMFEYRFSTDPNNYDSGLQSKLDVFTAVIDYLSAN